jgi:hypothetical protein
MESGAGRAVLVYPYPTVEAQFFKGLLREAGADGNLGRLGQPVASTPFHLILRNQSPPNGP